MEIYLVRHGQTDWNRDGLVQGRENNPLNETGILQAKEVAKKFKDIKVDYLMSSSLSRAYDTVKIISDINGWNLMIEKDDNFIERDFGILEGGPVEDYKKVKDFSQVTDCETNEELEARLREGIANIINIRHDDDVSIIGCHSHVLKACLCTFNPSVYDYKYSLENCAILKVSVVNKKIIDVQIGL